VVRRLIDSSPYRDRFILPGYLEDVEASYHAIDIVVHASIEPEPFGMVVPEGMAARKAVIAAAAGGPVEVIIDGQDGLLVPPGDIAALKNAIIELAADPERRRRFGENGYAKVRQGFTIAAAAAQLAAVYGALGRGTPVVVPAVEMEEAV
jgi:glycosyltransferase involved in cell wall biosynthesis